MRGFQKNWRTIFFVSILFFCVFFPLVEMRTNSENVFDESSQIAPVPIDKQQKSAEINVVPTWTHDSGKISYVRPVVISGDGTTILECSDTTVSLFDVSSNVPLWTHDVGGLVFDAAISADGNTSVVGTNRTTLFVFQRGSDVPLWTASCNDMVMAVDVSNDGSVIAAADMSGKIYLFERMSNQPKWTYNTEDMIFWLDLSSDGSTLVVPARNYTRSDTVYVFDKSSNSTLWKFNASEDFFQVSTSANGGIIAVTADDCLYVFQRDSNATLWKFRANNFYSVAVSEDGGTIVSGRWYVNSEVIYVWSSANNKTLWTFSGPSQISTVAVSGDGTKIVAGGLDNVTRVFAATSNKTALVHKSDNMISKVSISKSGTVFTVSSADGITHLFLLHQPTAGSPTISGKVYNTLTRINFSSQVERGTGSISAGLLHYSKDNVSWQTLPMCNITPLTNSVVKFNVSIGPFNEGSVFLYVWFNDTLGFESSSEVVTIDIDGTPPTLTGLVITPETPTSVEVVVVTVSANDTVSGVSTVLLRYSTDQGKSWFEVTMEHSSGLVYTGNIPAMPNATVVLYYIVAIDNVNNVKVLNNNGNYYSYTVYDSEPSPTTITGGNTTETPIPGENESLTPVVVSLSILVAFGIGSFAVFFVYLRRERLNRAKMLKNSGGKVLES